jgi:hypothetical protein
MHVGSLYLDARLPARLVSRLRKADIFIDSPGWKTARIQEVMAAGCCAMPPDDIPFLPAGKIAVEIQKVSAAA